MLGTNCDCRYRNDASVAGWVSYPHLARQIICKPGHAWHQTGADQLGWPTGLAKLLDQRAKALGLRQSPHC